MLEIETKFFLGSERAARQVCDGLSLAWIDGTYEVNRIFDYADRRLEKRGALVRVRERGGAGWLTYKEKTDRKVEHAKVRLEYDTGIARPEAAIRLLTQLGLSEVLWYERYRARHQKGEATIEIDCLPGGWFCEIEADPQPLGRLIETAGLKNQSGIVWSYPEIFRRFTRAQDVTAVAWTFEAVERGDYVLPPPGDAFWDRASSEA